MILTRERRSTLQRSFPSVRLSTTNVKCSDMGSNPVLCGERPVINRINCGTTFNASRRTNNNNNNNNNGGNWNCLEIIIREGRWFDPRWCHWNFSLT